MNIFVSNENPALAVYDLDDKRLVKMVLETCQILSTVMHLRNKIGPYKPTHTKHPCVLWAVDNALNFQWLLTYFQYICQEYTFRFEKIHACSKFIPTFEQYRKTWSPSESLTQSFVNCTKFKQESNVILAYQMALVDKWNNDKREPKWTKRQKPLWSNELKLAKMN